MSKFKVGDIIRGTSKTHYVVANTEMTKGEVLKTTEYGELEVKVKEHKHQGYIGARIDVVEDYFELAEPAEPVEEESDEIRKLKKIAKKFKKLVLKVSCIECRNIEDRSKCPLREVAFILGNDEITICDILNNTFLNIPLVGDEDE